VRLEETFELAFPRDAVWAAFHDVAMLVSCLPGASLASAPDEIPLRIEIAVKLGPVSARFSGEGSVAYAEDHTGTLTGSGSDRTTNSRVKGSAAFTLVPTASGTRVDLAIDYALSGMLAQVGRPGIVKEIAAGLTRQFAANLHTRIAGQTASTSPDAQPPLATADAQPAPLNAGALLWGALVGRRQTPTESDR